MNIDSKAYTDTVAINIIVIIVVNNKNINDFFARYYYQVKWVNKRIATNRGSRQPAVWLWLLTAKLTARAN